MTVTIEHETINCPLPTVGSPDWNWTSCTGCGGITVWTSPLVPWDVIETRSGTRVIDHSDGPFVYPSWMSASDVVTTRDILRTAEGEAIRRWQKDNPGRPST